jgi:hypothetical protein
MGSVIASGVRVVVYPRMAGEFVGPAEAFRAARERARMRPFASVRSDMSCLML